MSETPTQTPAPTPEPDNQFSDQELKVLTWRTEELERAGAPSHVATALASCRQVDLHQATVVIKGLLAQGKDLNLAVEILT